MIVGIDPGMSGAIAFLLDSGHPARVQPMPTLKETKTKRCLDEVSIVHLLSHRAQAIDMVFIEKAQSMPGQGVSSCFNYGAGWGILRGICAGIGIPYTLIHPTTWKRTMCRDVPKGKDASIIVAKRLWPNVSLLPTPRSRKDNDGMADALLIAEYGRRQLAGG